MSQAVCTIYFLAICFAMASCSNFTWPQPHKKYSARPPTGAPYCKAGVIPFCPTGLPSNTMPTVKPTDTLYVYAMKAPVWEFKYGNLLSKFDIMHDAIGFHHVNSGLNLTMEWYELFQLFNCTFPHEPERGVIRWCNQGATCIYSGIDAKHWKENGTLVKVAQINGTVFNNFATWVESDNNTYPFYETWTVVEKPRGKVWFNPFDCASWVIRAFDSMHQFGAEFNQSVQLNYTKVNLISKEPVFIANASDIDNHPLDRAKLLIFYSWFQHYESYAKMLEHLFGYFLEFLVDDDSFYFYYNDQYWRLPLQKPYFQLTYDAVPLPGANDTKKLN